MRGRDREAELHAARRIPGPRARRRCRAASGRPVAASSTVTSSRSRRPAGRKLARASSTAACTRASSRTWRRGVAARTGTAARASTVTTPGRAIRIIRQGIGRLPVQSRHTSVPRAERQSPMKVYGNVLEMIGRTPMLELRQLDAGPCQLFLKLELQNPGGLDQGPHRALDDRGSGAPRRPEARRHDHRGDGRQHRARPRARRAAERLPRRAGPAGQDEPGKDLQPARHGRGGRAHALGRREGPSGVLPGPRHAPRPRARLLPRQPVRQSRQPEGAPHDDRPGDPRADGRATSTRSSSASARAAPSPGSRSSSASACRPSR